MTFGNTFVWIIIIKACNSYFDAICLQ